MLAYREK